MAGIQSIVRDKAGNAIASTRITVHPAGSDGLAAIYEDKNLTVVKDNPFTSEPNGYYSFYAEPGFYDIDYEKSGFPTVELKDVELPFGVNGGTINGNVTINGNLTVNGTIVGQIDHGTLLGLLDDDHPQYLLVDGTRAMAGDLNMGEFDVTDVTRVTGPDTGGAARPGLSMSEGIAPELRLDFNEANLAGTPQVILNTDGINFDATIRAQGAADLQIGDNLDMNGFAINELLDPVLAQDAATKAYVDATVEGNIAFQCSMSVNQSIADATPLAALFDTIDYDEGGSVTLPGGGTIRVSTPGLWQFGVNFQFDASLVGERKATLFESVLPTLQLLGTTIVPASQQPGSGAGSGIVGRPFLITAADEFNVNVYQDSGGPLDLIGGPTFETCFWGILLHP
jgi:hypothetical protein